MKKKQNKLIWVILILIVAFALMIYFYMKPTDTSTNSSANSSDTTRTAVSSKQTITKTITTSGEISSAVTEKLSLDTNKYFKEIYVEKGDLVKSGDNLLQYSNGTYLIAPYDVVITEISVPDSGSVCTSANGVSIQSIKDLYVTLSISESDINTVAVGQEAEISVNVYENQKYTGTITKINQKGTYASDGSTFSAVVKFENDGNIKIGMSATCTVILEKAENVVAIPKEAVQTANNTKYVVVVNSDGSTENVTVETGISNDAYIEIKSGLEIGKTVQYTATTSSSNSNGGFRLNSGGMLQGNPTGAQQVRVRPSM